MSKPPQEMFRGFATAIITPFKLDGSIDELALRRLVNRQVSEGAHFIVPCGTTGESPTLDHAEHLRVVQITLEEVAGRIPVLAGAGGYNTAHIISLANELEAMGVDGLLSVTPYYNKPNQAGVIAHYEAISKATTKPILLYSVQPRTNVNIEPDTMAILAKLDNVIGVKEASGNVSQVASIIARVPSDFLVLSGDDAVTLPVIALGGHGIISVVGNQIPGPMSKFAELALAGDFAGARAIQAKYQRLFEANFLEPNPIPVKESMAMMGLCESTTRLPMVPASDGLKVKLQALLKEVGLLAS